MYAKWHNLNHGLSLNIFTTLILTYTTHNINPDPTNPNLNLNPNPVNPDPG